MTGVISDGAQHSGDIMRRLADLERTIEQLRAERRLTLSSASLRGSLTVVDEAGDPQLLIGLLPSGNYGLAAINELGETVELASLAFGIRSATVPDLEGTSSSEPTDLATPGPSVEVTVGTSGRMIVIVSADVRAPFVNQDPELGCTSLMSYEITGATDRAAGANTALYVAHVESIAAPNGINVAASRVSLQTSLNPGLHTVTAKYWRTGSSDPDVDDADFAARNITVIPY